MMEKHTTRIKQLLQDRILVRPDMKEEVTDSGIILPSEIKENEKTHKAEVVQVGPGLHGDPSGMLLQPGDRVAYSQLAGVEADLNDERLLILRQSDIIAVLGE